MLIIRDQQLKMWESYLWTQTHFLYISGFCHFRCQPSYKPCHWSIPPRHLQWEHGRLAGCFYSHLRHLVHHGSCARIFAWEAQASQLGLSDLMGEGRPIWGEGPLWFLCVSLHVLFLWACQPKMTVLEEWFSKHWCESVLSPRYR